MPVISAKRTGRAARFLIAVVLVGTIAHALHSGTGVGGSRLDSLFNDWVYNAVMLSAACACLLRGATIPGERAAWLCIGAGLAAWSAGEIYWTTHLSGLETIPYPSLADAFYVALYPGLYAGIVLLVRSRVPRFHASLWLDGAIGGLTVAAFGAAILSPVIVDATGGSAAAVATNLTYPLGDLLLLSFVAGIAAITGWRPDGAWLLVGLGLAASAVADSSYLYLESAGTYSEGTLVDTMWLAGALLLTLAAWRTERFRAIRLEGLRVLAFPGAFALGALALLLLGGFSHLPPVALVFAGGALLLVVVRMVLAFAENLNLLAAANEAALTDAVTGIGNRRKLSRDLSIALREATLDHPQLFILFDLNGFKSYNDNFGHHAGDLMLRRLAQDLDAAVEPHGGAYRLGGDEFCVLASTSRVKPDSVITAAHAALTIEDEGFEIGSSYGTAAIPLEVKTASQALRVADARMYAQKGRIAEKRPGAETLVRIA